jgi:hypothetical protein
MRHAASWQGLYGECGAGKQLSLSTNSTLRPFFLRAAIGRTERTRQLVWLAAPACADLAS